MAPERLRGFFRGRAGAGEGTPGGHGLGLAVSKGLVEAHGGHIGAESARPGCDTTFTFTVPVAGEPDRWRSAISTCARFSKPDGSQSLNLQRGALETADVDAVDVSTTSRPAST